MTRKTWMTGTAACAVGLSVALTGCSAGDVQKAERADTLGCTEAPAQAVDAIKSMLGAGVTLGEGSSGFERDGRWLVAAPIVDVDGITQNAGFSVDLSTDPVAVMAESELARESSSAPAGSAAAADDVLDCIFTVS